MIYIDSETVGLTGPMVLFQYAIDDGPIVLHELWKEPIKNTLELFESVVDAKDGICGFNLSFDWFHLTKIYNYFRILHEGGWEGPPTINAIKLIDAEAPAIWYPKPYKPIDLMLYARKHDYQHTMGRKGIFIRKIPLEIADKLCEYLEETVKLPDICFAKRINKPRWEVKPVSNELADIQLKFAPSSKLGAICYDAFGEGKDDFPIPDHLQPTEVSWMPYGEYGDRPWTSVIHQHINFWAVSEKARYYATRDIHLTRKLHRHFGSPEGGDTDSVLAVAIGAYRWKGYKINHEKAKLLRSTYLHEARQAPTGSKRVLEIIKPMLSPVEAVTVKDTKKHTLESLMKRTDAAGEFATKVYKARRAKLRLSMIDKLLKVKRLCPEFKIIGTKSNRQAGGSDDKSKGSINPQGIPKEKEFRELIEFAFEDEVVEAGDGKSYEIVILDGVMNCPNLHKELVAGKNFHGLMGKVWYGADYDAVMLTKKEAGGTYDKSKTADFAWVYGGMKNKLAAVLGIEVSEAEKADERLKELYPEVAQARNEVALRFCSMRQPAGLGTNVEWHEPSDYIESVLGFKRYFTLENNICKALFKIASKPPQWLRVAKGTVVRRVDRGAQTFFGACLSALYAAAFSIQASNMRAACNHIIQSPGGEMMKELQREFDDEQPYGINPFRVRSMNIHDEGIVVHDGTIDCKEILERFLIRFRPKFPLLAWSWSVIKNWADKE